VRYANVPDELRWRPFTTAQARTFGVTRSALRSAPWRHVFRDVWVHEDVPDSRALRFAAVRLILPDGAFVCGLTADWLYGIDVQDPRGDLIWIGCRTGCRLRARAGCTVREISVEDHDLQLIDGIWVTTPCRTVFDSGRWLTLVEGVVVADALTHAGLVTVDQLREYARRHRGLRGVRRFDRVVDLTEPKSESPMETRVRLLLVLAGLPRPEAQLKILDEREKPFARADLGYREQRLLIEYDGSWHFATRRADDRRRDRLRDLGWTVIVVSKEDYYDHPKATIARVRHGLEKAERRRA
jgi:hypothetical protein